LHCPEYFDFAFDLIRFAHLNILLYVAFLLIIIYIYMAHYS
jgi:hypothetical protein